MQYKLFLDDFREPTDCLTYMHRKIGAKNPIYAEEGWKVAVNFHHFKKIVLALGLPSFVSFDHDLADEHYGLSEKTDALDWREYYEKDDREMTGYDAAKWMVEYCIENKKPFPDYAVHSANPVGSQNIEAYINNFLKNGPHTSEGAARGR